MHRWKVAAAAALVVTAVAALSVFAPHVQGQDRLVIAQAQDEAHRAHMFGGQIGVTVRDADAPGGVVVEDVRSNSPAEKAGVKEGDVLVEFDGERVRSTRQFSRLVDETPQGRSVKMIVQRNGQRTTLEVTPEAREFGRVAPFPFERFRGEVVPSPRLRRDFDHWTPRVPDFDTRLLPEIEVYSSRPGRLGVQIQDLEDQLAEYFGVKGGALVTSVLKDSPAARGGLKAGDVITKIGDENVEDAGDVRREVRRMDDDKEFVVEVMRDRKAVTLKVKLDPPSSSTRKPGTATEWF